MEIPVPELRAFHRELGHILSKEQMRKDIRSGVKKVERVIKKSESQVMVF